MRRFELPSGTSDRRCSVPDLLAARLKAGTFSLDPERYDADLRAARMQGRAFALNVDLKDGRTIAVVNQPMPGGGWVASRCADPIFPIAPRSMSASFPRSDWHWFLMKALRWFAWNTNNWLYVLFAGAGSGCVQNGGSLAQGSDGYRALFHIVQGRLGKCCSGTTTID
jgi:hypothetical protein